VPPAYRYISEPAAAEEAFRSLAAESEIAFDLEADSLHNYREKICLVQISSPSENIIVDPFACREAFHVLESLLGDAGIRKVLHGSDYDIRLLKKDLGCGVRNVFDTMVAAQLTGREQYGLAALLEESFSVSLNKKHQRADWSVRPLTEDLLAYAVLDTAWLLQLKELLEEDLSRLGRLSWAEEEFRLLEEIEPQPAKELSALNVKGARRLEPRQQVLLQGLLEIREKAAEELDRPPFKVLSNQVLLAWAENPPLSRKNILATRGASKRILAHLADDLLASLAGPVQDVELPRGRRESFAPMTGEERKRLQLLKEVRAGMEEKLSLPPGLLVNSATLEKMARMEVGEALDFIASGLKDWQREVAGEELARVLNDQSAGPVPPG